MPSRVTAYGDVTPIWKRRFSSEPSRNARIRRGVSGRLKSRAAASCRSAEARYVDVMTSHVASRRKTIRTVARRLAIFTSYFSCTPTAPHAEFRARRPSKHRLISSARCKNLFLAAQISKPFAEFSTIIYFAIDTAYIRRSNE